MVACIAGTDPEKSQALPYIKGRDQVIIPKHSRNQYDFGVRMTGVEIVEVDSPDELQQKLSARTAMVYILSSPLAAEGPLSIARVCAIARAAGVPVFVDAAAEEPLVPNIHLQQGATLVGYSGGKCLRGPQSSGLLIGQKDLARPPTFTLRRTTITAVLSSAAKKRQWGCWRRCGSGTNAITPPNSGSGFRGYSTSRSAYNRCLPSLRSTCIRKTCPIARRACSFTGMGARSASLVRSWRRRLDAGSPRIIVHESGGVRPADMTSWVTIMPYMMEAGEERIIADALYAGLSKPAELEERVAAVG